ncbi:MAG: ADP-ribosylglycohydrolase family protein [Phycisphaeraceae bacterium]|nr:ADP-ribosylglycohydrolase family protein [Phycisphaeraceae bacterium]
MGEITESETRLDPPKPIADRAVAALLGLALGDAVGTTLEFKAPGSFSPLTDMVGGGPFNLKPGEWTDDTSMALCLAESLIECSGFDPRDQMERYIRWWKDGHFSVKGHCFDIGGTTRSALSGFRKSARAYSGSTASDSAGNGSLMRLAPVPVAFAPRPSLAIALAGESSRTTHGAAECIDACRYFAALLVGLINGESKQAVLASDYCPVPGLWKLEPLAPKVQAIAAGSFKAKRPPEIRGGGYVIECLEAALWAFHATDDFQDAILAAANLGDDADTTAAVCGQIAGACYGTEGLPQHWLDKLARADTISELATGLVKMW